MGKIYEQCPQATEGMEVWIHKFKEENKRWPTFAEIGRHHFLEPATVKYRLEKYGTIPGYRDGTIRRTFRAAKGTTQRRGKEKSRAEETQPT